MTTPQLFQVSFWQATIAQVVHSAAGGALAALAVGGVGAADPQSHVSVPWWGLFMGAVVGGLTALLLALSSSLVPGTGPASFLPAKQTQRTQSRPRRRRATPKARKATTTADLKQPPPAEPPHEAG